MLRRLLALLRDAPVTVGGTRPGAAARSCLVAAAAAGPVPVEVRGDPFGCGPAVLGQRVALALAAEMTGLAVRFTADPAQAPPRPALRVVVAFDPPPAAGAADLCAARDLAPSPRRGRVAVLAALCDGAGVLASATGHTRADAPDDRRLGRMLRQLAHALLDETGSC